MCSDAYIDPAGRGFGRRVFVLTDNLDVINRLFTIFLMLKVLNAFVDRIHGALAVR